MQDVAPPITDVRCEHIESGWFCTVEVVEDCSPMEVALHRALHHGPHTFEERMAGGDPLQGGIEGEESLVKYDLFVITPQLPIARLETFAIGQQQARYSSYPVDVALLPVCPWCHPCQRGSLHEKIFNDLWHQPAFLGLLGLAHNG